MNEHVSRIRALILMSSVNLVPQLATRFASRTVRPLRQR